MLKKLILLFTIFISCSVNALPIYSPSQMQVIHDRGYIRVAIFGQSLEPFIIRTDANHLSGIDIDLAYEVGNLLGVQVKFDQSAQTYDQLLRLVYDRKVDIAISGIIRTPTRAKSVRFSSPYYIYPAGLLVNRIKYDQLNGNFLTALNSKGIKIGALEGSAFLGYVEYLYPKAKLILYKTSAEMLQDVVADKADACMMDELVVRQWLAQQPERALRTRYLVIPEYNVGYAIVTSYSYPNFGQWLSEFVDEAKSIGFTQRLLKKYTRSD